MICRIFNKAGAKKGALLQGQDFLLEATSPLNSISLPSLLEDPSTLFDQSQSHEAATDGLQNSFLIQHQENELKNLLLSPLVSQSHHILSINGLQFQPSFSPATPIAINTNAETNKNIDTNANSNQSPSMLFKSLISHQDCTLKEQSTVLKQCKTEANFSHFQPPDASLNWVVNKNHHHQNQYQYPLSFEMDCNVLGVTAGAADSDITAHEMSTSMAFSRAGFQMMLDAPIRLPAESWPLDS